ncbi:MAG: bifunctional folylpolyglutamate synthase/dihydrofolate synthase [Candidatus Acidiferrales bacterium]
MNYEEASRYLLTLGRELAAPRQPAPASGSGAGGATAQKFDLENISALAKYLGAPERACPCVHIAGTNGKGSTAAMLESVLRAAGFATGLYTSPHLERINERIQVSGEPLEDEEFAASFTRVAQAIETLMAAGTLRAHPTYFECLTAMAFEAFARRPVDFAVYEVGMGGRLDATNIVAPEAAVITAIDFDHENYLGHSIEQIAGEKAGIIKPGAWVVSAAGRAEARGVITRRAAELDGRLVDIDEQYRIENVRSEGGYYGATIRPQHSKRGLEIELPIAGRFQLRNAATVIATARLLRERGFPIGDEHLREGIRKVRWPGRLERIGANPAVYLDGSHNPAGAQELQKFWQEHFSQSRIILVYGAMRDKAVDEIAGLLFPQAATVILTEPRQPRAISADVLAQMTQHLASQFEVVADPDAALERAIELAGPGDAVFASGSLYLVGDLRHRLRNRSGSFTTDDQQVAAGDTVRFV